MTYMSNTLAKYLDSRSPICSTRSMEKLGKRSLVAWTASECCWQLLTEPCVIVIVPNVLAQSYRHCAFLSNLFYTSAKKGLEETVDCDPMEWQGGK